MAFLSAALTTGDVVLSRRPNSWDGLFQLDSLTDVPASLLSDSDPNPDKKGELAREPYAEKPAVVANQKMRTATTKTAKTLKIIAEVKKLHLKTNRHDHLYARH